MNAAICKVTIDHAQTGAPGGYLFVSGPVTAPSGNLALKVTAGQGLTRDDGNPAQAGDWLSCQPGGTWQTRPPDRPVEAYETVAVAGLLATYCPDGTQPLAFLFLSAVPNS